MYERNILAKIVASFAIVSASCGCRGCAWGFTPCSRIGNNPQRKFPVVHTAQDSSHWIYELASIEQPSKTGDSLLVHLELVVVPLAVAHELLIRPAVRSHRLLIQVEVDVGPCDFMVPLTRVPLQKGLDVWNELRHWRERRAHLAVCLGTAAL